MLVALMRREYGVTGEWLAMVGRCYENSGNWTVRREAKNKAKSAAVRIHNIRCKLLQLGLPNIILTEIDGWLRRYRIGPGLEVVAAYVMTGGRET
jgi:hypothetical protein